jgi:hypothetical protein
LFPEQQVRDPSTLCWPSRNISSHGTFKRHPRSANREAAAMDASVKKKFEDVDFEALVEDIATLKSDIAKVAVQLKNATVDTALDSAGDLAEQLSAEAGALYKDLNKRGKRAAKVLNTKMEDQPALSLLVAFALGFLASRLVLR